MNIPTEKKHCCKGWRLVIWPKIVLNFSLEFLIIIVPHTQVKNQIFPLMSFLEVLGNIINGISVSFFKARSRESHRDKPTSDVG